MGAYQRNETVGLAALLLFLMACFPDHVTVIGVLFLVSVLALDDLSETAFLQAMLDGTIRQTSTEPVIYIIDPSCRFKLFVWRQAQFMQPVRNVPRSD
ncbi:hypothetical protein [Paraburkholderia sp. SIMBA_054]|uniref:hypothetical protein n=1 Tax=Paraburkholderia sp. SIMBA_054 TaxID=3085795 RepID=UPI00397DDD01